MNRKIEMTRVRPLNTALTILMARACLAGMHKIASRPTHAAEQ
jgi:hypothetical protein